MKSGAQRPQSGAPAAAELRLLLAVASQREASRIERAVSFASGRRWAMQRVSRLAHARAAIGQGSFDALLLDGRFPDGSAQDLIAELAATGDPVPVIVLTDDQDDGLGPAVLSLGAEDFVGKGQLDGQILMRSVYHACARHRLRRELRRENRLLEALVRERTREVTEVQDLERKRLAEALHDESGQWMTALNAQLAAVERRCGQLELGDDDGLAALRSQVAACRQMCEGAMGEISRICRHLHPSVIEHGGLSAALQSWQMPHAEPAVEVRVDGVDDASLPPEVQLAVYRCAQESLTNARKHARASTIRIALVRTADGLELCVTDDGIGLSNPAQRAIPAGVGLVGMRQRIEQLAGSLDIGPASPRGTAIRVRVPLAS